MGKENYDIAQEDNPDKTDDYQGPESDEARARKVIKLDAINVVRELMLTRIKEGKAPLSIRKKFLAVIDQLDAIASFDQKELLAGIRDEMDQQKDKEDKKK